MIKEAIEKLTRFKDLDDTEAFSTMKYIMEGRASDSQISAFLIALKMKGECAGEISAFSRAMLEKANRIRTTTTVKERLLYIIYYFNYYLLRYLKLNILLVHLNNCTPKQAIHLVHQLRAWPD